MPGLTDDPTETEFELLTPSYRATVRGGQLSITEWGSVLMSLEKLRTSAADTEDDQATIVDLVIIGEHRDELIVSRSSKRHDGKNVGQTLLNWASQVGYRRVWLPDQVVDIEPSADQIGTAKLDCPTCMNEFTGEGPEFWLMVRKAKMFPHFCPACGCEVPQWEVSSEAPVPSSSDQTQALIDGP